MALVEIPFTPAPENSYPTEWDTAAVWSLASSATGATQDPHTQASVLRIGVPESAMHSGCGVVNGGPQKLCLHSGPCECDLLGQRAFADVMKSRI